MCHVADNLYMNFNFHIYN